MWKVSAPLLRCGLWGTWPRRVGEAAGARALASAAAQGRVGDGTRGRPRKEGLALNLQLCARWRARPCVRPCLVGQQWNSPFLQEVFVERFL